MSHERVLVVDDERDYLQLMQSHLQRRGYQVHTAMNGQEAMARLQNGESFEVMVTDLMMPEMDGLELLREARGLDPMLEVVVISGAGTLESAISSMRAGGAFDYLPKPLETITDLSAAVERAAAHRQLRLDKERLQAQVAAERERLAAVMDNTGDAILAANADGVVTVANPTACQLIGRDHPVGKDVHACLPSQLLAFLANWQAYERQQPTITEMPWPTGSTYMASLTAIQGEDEESIGGWVMVLRDITQHKLLNEMKMRLLFQSADKLRAPLAHAISTLVELNELPEAHGEAFTGAVEAIMNRLSSIRTWTDDLFHLVQSEAGIGAEPERLDLAEVTREYERFLEEGLVTEKGLHLDVIVESTPPIFADANLARSLLQRLVRQAAWRAPRASDLRLHVGSQRGQAWVEVADEGVAIFEEEAPQRFERYFGADPDPSGATGLELALVKTLADRTGGQLWIWSHKPQGNTFAVGFPAAT